MDNASIHKSEQLQQMIEDRYVNTWILLCYAVTLKFPLRGM